MGRTFLDFFSREKENDEDLKSKLINGPRRES